MTFEQAHSLFPVAVRCPLSLLGPPEQAYQARALFEKHVEDMMALVSLLAARTYTVVVFDDHDTKHVFEKLKGMSNPTHPDAKQMEDVQEYLSGLIASGDSAYRGLFKVIKGAHGIEAMNRQIAQFPKNAKLQKWQPLVNILIVRRLPEFITNLFLLGTMDNAMQKYQMAFSFADVVQRLHNQQVALQEEYANDMTFSNEGQRIAAFKRAKNKLRGQLVSAMMMSGQNFGLHWMLSNVSDPVWGGASQGADRAIR